MRYTLRMSKLLYEHAPWSISKSDLAAKCGFAFKLRYIDRVAVLSSEASKVGTAAHRVQELVLQDVDPKQALAQTFDEMPDLVHDERLKVAALLDNVIAFRERIARFKDRTPILEEFYEKNWAIDKDFKAVQGSSGLFFRGVVDYALLTAEHYLVVFDHKSGRQHPVEKYAKQLDAYAVLARAAIPTLRGVQGALHYIATRDVVWHHMRLAPYIDTTLRAHMKEYLTKRADALGSYAPRPNDLCGWCDYLQHCEIGQRHVAAKKEAKRIETNAKAREKRAAKKRELNVVYEDD